MRPRGPTRCNLSWDTQCRTQLPLQRSKTNHTPSSQPCLLRGLLVVQADPKLPSSLPICLASSFSASGSLGCSALYSMLRLIMAEQDSKLSCLLCLKCRQPGHIVKECSLSRWNYESGWFFSPARKALDLGDTTGGAHNVLCQRCQDLNILKLLQEETPWKSTADLDRAAREGNMESIRSLGLTGSVEFRKDCPLCRCLFAMTPHPSSSSQEVLVLPQPTMTRLAGENGYHFHTEEQRRYARCLLVVLKPSSLNMEFSIAAQRGDALCVLERANPAGGVTLGGRQLSPDRLDFKLVESWLSRCKRLHNADCLPVQTAALRDVRLVDVKSRRVVDYPEPPCDYLALSYVWGGVSQRDFQVGTTLDKLPQTIEDAMLVVTELGKQYLWVDSLCIDQRDKTDKAHQIKKMWSIYRGSYLTIIALSGHSAYTGLPRMGPGTRASPQLTCCVDGTTLVGLMPTLSQQIWSTPWGSRAWTLQEGLLSPRCLYISDEQMYFECDGMQCSESLDESGSRAHNICSASVPSQDWLYATIGSGCLRNSLNNPLNRIDHYGAKLTLYSYRRMTEDEDGINAFSGILQRLEDMYPKAYFWGLPIDDFQWSLLWRSHAPPTRRKGFPSWSWAGWKGGLWHGQPMDITRPHQYPVHLRIWKAQEQANSLVELFTSSEAPTDTSIEVDSPRKAHPIFNAAHMHPKGSNFDLDQYPNAYEHGHLFVEGIVFDFVPDWSKPVTNTQQSNREEIFLFPIRGVVCLIIIMSTDRYIDRSATQRSVQFLLLARDYSKHLGRRWHFHLMLLDTQGETTVRGTVLQVLVPEGKTEVLEALKPQKRRLVIV